MHNVREGTLKGGLTYITFGDGPPLVVFPGLGPSNANPTGLLLRYGSAGREAEDMDGSFEPILDRCGVVGGEIGHRRIGCKSDLSVEPVDGEGSC